MLYAYDSGWLIQAISGKITAFLMGFRLPMQKLLFALVLVFASLGPVSANMLAEAQDLFEAGKHEQAMSRVNDYLRTQPKSAEARFLKGLILVERGESAEAIDVFTSLTKDYPELPEPYNNLAVIHAAEGDYDSAREALQAALKTHPSYATAYENLGDIYAKLASEAYQQALELEKQDRGKLKVKLSLIGDLFTDESKAKPQVVAAAKPVQPAARPTPIVKKSEPIKTVATKPVPVKPVITRPVAISKPLQSMPDADHKALITQAMQSWASAWSAQDVDAYLSHYAETFKPATGSLSKWRMQRHIRLAKPAYIRIALDELKLLTLSKNRARIEVVQTYESNTYKDQSRKRFDLLLVNGQWKINREVSI